MAQQVKEAGVGKEGGQVREIRPGVTVCMVQMVKTFKILL